MGIQHWFVLATPWYHLLMLIVAAIIGIVMVRDHRRLNRQLRQQDKILLSLYRHLVMTNEKTPAHRALGGD